MESLKPALETRRREHLYRQRRVLEGATGVKATLDGRRVVVFCSNDYLGLANHPTVVQAFIAAAREYGVGAGAAHLVSGHRRVHHALEDTLAEFTGRPRVLLFSTGYMANLGVMGALLGRHDRVYEDRLNHASLLDAARYARASLQRYPHGELVALEEGLAKSGSSGRRLLVTDGVFSMDGDLARLPALAALARRYEAWLMVDDAHGLGVLGAGGGGCLEYFGLGVHEVPILMGTLGKGLGTFGAFVAGDEALIETLIQQARTYVYTTAPPPAVAAATLAALEVVRSEPERRARLHSLVRRFRTGAEQLGLHLMPSDTPIQPLLVGGEEEALGLSGRLLEAGFLVSAIRPPTVPAGTSRLRVTLSAGHSSVQVDRLLEALAA